MKQLGLLKQQLCMAGWLLAAILLVSINGLAFISLEDTALDGEPANLRLLRSQLAMLESISAAKAHDVTDMRALQRFFAAYHPSRSSSPAPEAKPAIGSPVTEAGENAALPGLAGVLQKLDNQGLPFFLAVLGGRVCSEKDQVGHFTVGAISAEGVVLQRAGMRWFLPSPQAYYNSDQGR